MAPRISVSQITTLRSSFADDLRALRRGRPGRDRRLGAETRRGRGRRAARALRGERPRVRPPPCPPSPRSCRCRCSAARRIRTSGSRRTATRSHGSRPFRPSGLVCLTGTGAGRDPDEARATVVDGLRTIAAEAERHGVRVGIEPYQRDGGEQWTIVSSIPDAVELIHEAGDPPALGIQFDVWHLWNTADALRRHRERGRPLHRRARLRRARADARLGRSRAARRRRRPTCRAILRRARRRRLGRSLRHRDLLRRRHVRRRRTPTRIWACPGGRRRSRRRASVRALLGRHPSPPAPPRDNEGVRDEKTEFPAGAHPGRRRGRRRRARGDGGGAHDAPAAAPIVIGWAFDSKGAMAPFDNPALAAAQLRVKQLNAKGGVDGRQLQIRTCDTQGNKPAIAKACALKLLGGGANVIFTTCDVDFAAPVVQEAINRGMLAVAPCIGTDQMGPKRFGAEGQARVQLRQRRAGRRLGDGAVRVGQGLAHRRARDRRRDRLLQGRRARRSRCAGSSSAARSSTQETYHSLGGNDVQNAVSRLNNEKADVIVTSTAGAFGALSTLISGLRSLGNNTPILNSWAGDGTYWLPKSPQVTNYWFVTFASVVRRRPESRPSTSSPSRSTRAPAASSPARPRSTASSPRSAAPAARRTAQRSPRRWRSSRRCRRCRAS